MLPSDHSMSRNRKLAVSAFLCAFVANSALASEKAPADEGEGYPRKWVPNEVTEIPKRFNADLAKRKIGGRVADCRWGVDVAVGTAKGNHSYGAVCMLRKGKTKELVRICNDEMVGHFRMEMAPQGTMTDEARFRDVVAFVRKNCYGG